MDIALYNPSEPEYDTTGYKLRNRRKELELSGEQLAKLSGITKSQILKAERCQFYLNKSHYEKVCAALQIDPESIMDNEYKFFYEGYGQAIEFLINKIGIQDVLNSIQVQRATLYNWKSGHWMPQFEQRRTLVKLYNELLK